MVLELLGSGLLGVIALAAPVWGRVALARQCRRAVTDLAADGRSVRARQRISVRECSIELEVEEAPGARR